MSNGADQLLNELRQTIYSYQPRYEHLVQQMRQRDADEKAWLAHVRTVIEADLSAIAGKQTELAHVRAKIRSL